MGGQKIFQLIIEAQQTQKAKKSKYKVNVCKVATKDDYQ